MTFIAADRHQRCVTYRQYDMGNRVCVIRTYASKADLQNDTPYRMSTHEYASDWSRQDMINALRIDGAKEIS